MFQSDSVYGLRLEANGPIPGLVQRQSTTPPDIRIFIGTTPDRSEMPPAVAAKPVFASPDLNERGQPYFIVDELSGGDFYRLSYQDGAEFVVDCAGTRIWVNWPPSLSLEEISSYLFGPVIGWVLRLRGALCLHASAVTVDGAAIAFVGDSGAGKSTLAAGFARRGHAVVADDVVAVFEYSGAPLVVPGYPELRLWPDSASALYATDDSRFESAPENEKLNLNVQQCGHDFQERPLPLSAIYILNDDLPGESASMRSMTQREAMIALVANTHAGRLLGQTAREKEFVLLADLIARVPVRELTRGTDLSKLPELCDAILSDLEERDSLAGLVRAAGA